MALVISGRDSVAFDVTTRSIAEICGRRMQGRWNSSDCYLLCEIRAHNILLQWHTSTLTNNLAHS